MEIHVVNSVTRPDPFVLKIGFELKMGNYCGYRAAVISGDSFVKLSHLFKFTKKTTSLIVPLKNK